MVVELFCDSYSKATFYRYTSDFMGVCSYFILEQNLLRIIDPGKFDESVFRWLHSFEYMDKVIYITHEHFDHHYSASKLLMLKNTRLYVPSSSFLESLGDLRKNLSYYFNLEIKTSTSLTVDYTDLEVIKAPGHSLESYCYIYKNILFGGDTVINPEYIILKLPGSNKIDFFNSVKQIKKIANPESIVLPGHGNYFFLKNWNI